MAKYELKLPKMGESVYEAKIIRWLKKVGDVISVDEPIAEVATDKVDSEVPSPVEGTILEIRYKEGDDVQIGEIIAIIETNVAENQANFAEINPVVNNNKTKTDEKSTSVIDYSNVVETQAKEPQKRLYSPLVRQIAEKENISLQELNTIKGSGLNNRVTKKDIEAYIEQKKSKQQPDVEDTVIEMSRMRKLIAEHMIKSKQTSAHVTSFIEARVGRLVRFREQQKQIFEKEFKQKLTYTHLIIDAIAKAIKEYPLLNSSVEGDKIIVKHSINIGFATALPDGNLIVPVVKNVDKKTLLQITEEVNDLINKARNNSLSPDDISGGTFTFTNLGQFGTLSGTPIINQPQVAILAAGAIQKKVVVIETDNGDTIGIEPTMILSLSYDHRIIDGALGGLFLKKVAEILENYDKIFYLT